jgi:hypothetical protein
MRLKRLSTFKLSFASWLILLAMFVALPLIGLSIYSTFRYADDRSQRFELQLHEKAENLALQQDAYFRKIEHLLTALSHSPAAQRAMSRSCTRPPNCCRKVRQRFPPSAWWTRMTRWYF